MSDQHWFHPKDWHARLAFEAIKDRLGPLLAEVFPDFQLTHCGFERRPEGLRFIDGRDEIQVKLHLRPIGEAYAIQTRLEAMAMPELLTKERNK
jgi:hypothetical protein